MRQLVSNLKREKKIFIGDFDSYTIIRYGIPPEKLITLSKIGLLLFDRLMMPAAFFWQSDTLHRLFFELEPAIASGLVLPVIREYSTTTDIQDYFNMRVDESEKIGPMTVFQQPELASELANPHHVQYVKLLEATNTFAHLDQNSIREVYKNNWEKDLTDKYKFDINSLRSLLIQANLPIEQIPVIIQTLQNATSHPQFSRATCIELIQSLFPKGRCQELLVERASWLYLKSNADAYGCGLYYSRNPYNGMIFTDNLRLLAKTLSVFGITEEVISQLTIEDILQIITSSEYKLFIDSYRDLISNMNIAQDNIVLRVQRSITNEMRKETGLPQFYKVLQLIQSISSTVFISLLANHFSNNIISYSMLVYTGSATIISEILKRITAANSVMSSSNFTDFKNYVISKEYEKSINKHTGVII